MKRTLLFILISFVTISLSEAQFNWNKYYTLDSGGFFPVLFDIEQTHDDQIFFLGSELLGSTTVFKVDKFTGDTIWTKTDSSASKIMKIPNSTDYYIIRKEDNFFSSENWLSRVDGNMNTVWKRDFELNAEVIQDMEVLSDGSAICFGNYSSTSGLGWFLRRVDENNNLIFIDSLIQLPFTMTLDIEVLPNDELILANQENSEITIYKYSPMGMYMDSVEIILNGISFDDNVYFGANKWDATIAVIGGIEYDTTNIDSNDVAGFFYELDSNLLINAFSEDTSIIYTGKPGFFSLGGTVRQEISLFDTTGQFNLGFYLGTSSFVNYQLGTSPNNLPNLPVALEYIAPIGMVVSGTDFTSFWAASVSTIINDLSNSSQTKKVKVFPVPSDNYVTFSSSIENETNMKMTIFDIQGRKIAEQELNQSTYTLDVSEFGEGLYFYEFEAAGYSERGKFQVLH